MRDKTESKKLADKKKKLKIIQEYLTTNITPSELKKKYEIGMSSFIPEWIKQFNIDLYYLGINQEIIDKRNIKSDKQNNIKLLKIIEDNKENICIPNFTKEERERIIEDYLSSNISQLEISKKYKIKWRGNISIWINNIEKELILKSNSFDYTPSISSSALGHLEI